MTGFSLGTSFGVSNVIVPKGGPKAIPALLDFTNTGDIEIDGQQVVTMGNIDYIQGVYIDNADNPVPVTFVMGVTGQRIVAAANTQGYYNILMPNPPQIVVTCAQANGRKVPLCFYNVPIQASTWKVS